MEDLAHPHRVVAVLEEVLRQRLPVRAAAVPEVGVQVPDLRRAPAPGAPEPWKSESESKLVEAASLNRVGMILSRSIVLGLGSLIVVQIRGTPSTQT